MIMVNGTDLLNKVYPIGSIYLTTNSVNPSNLMGGTWVRFGKGRTLVGVNESDTDFSTVEKTGGSKTHKLTVNELPKHNIGMVEVSSSPELRPDWDNSSSDYFASGTVGGDQPHNNLQPYITVYMWKRTA